MSLDELFERTVVVTKLIWRKHGNEITRHEVVRVVAQPKTEGSDAG